MRKTDVLPEEEKPCISDATTDVFSGGSVVVRAS
jgi:hypothetical protein